MNLNPLTWFGGNAASASNANANTTEIITSQDSADSAALLNRAVATAKKMIGYLGGGVMTALRGGLPGGWSSDHREEANHNTGWNYIAIHAISAQCASADVSVFHDDNQVKQSRRKCLRAMHGSLRRWKSIYGQDDKETEPLGPDHPLVKILKRPNRKESGSIFRYRCAQQIRLTGACLIWNVPSKQPGANGEPWVYERFVIPTAVATPVVVPTEEHPLGGWRIDGRASRYTTVTDDGFIEFPGWYRMLGKVIDARQVQVIRLPHASWLDDGQSPLAACALWTDTATQVDVARFHQMKRGLDPSIWINLGEGSQLDQDSLDRYAEKVNKKYAGAEKAGSAYVTQGEATVTPLSQNPKDMGYHEGFEDSKACGLAIHQTPPVAVGLQEPGAFAAYAASMLAWRHAAIQPLLDMLAESETEFLAPRYGTGLTVEIEAQEVGDNELTEKQLANDLAARARTRNEWRAIRGLKPLPGPEGEELVGNGPAVTQVGAGMTVDGSGKPGQSTNGNTNANGSNPFNSLRTPLMADNGKGTGEEATPPQINGKSHGATNGHHHNGHGHHTNGHGGTNRLSAALKAAQEEFEALELERN